MTLREKTVVLEQEADRLDAELDDVAETLSDADPGTPGAKLLQQEGNNLEAALAGVHHLIAEHGPDAEVTVGALDAGEFAQVEDRAAAMRAQTDQPGGLPGARRNVFAAVALRDAPFLDENPDLDARINAVTSQPRGVVLWLEDLNNDLSTVSEGNFKRFAERLTANSAD